MSDIPSPNLTPDNEHYRKLTGDQRQSLHAKVNDGVKKLSLIGLREPTPTDLERLLFRAQAKIHLIQQEAAQINNLAQGFDKNREMLWLHLGKACIAQFREFSREELVIILSHHFSQKMMEDL